MTTRGLVWLVIIVLLCAVRPAPSAQEATLESPDGSILVTLTLIGGRPQYAVTRNGRAVIEPSPLGLRFKGEGALEDGFELTDARRRSFDETWDTVWGRSSTVRDRGNELAATLRTTDRLRRTLDLVFRAYDDGVAFRYVLPKQPNLADFAIAPEETRFRFAGDQTVFWSQADYDSYEHLYRMTPLSEMRGANTPVTMRTAEGLHICLHEGRLADYADMTPEPAAGEPLTLRSELVPWPDGVKVRGRTPFATPWRVVLMTDRAGGLVESNLILNLNEPCALEDTSWIRPMKYVGIWWAMHVERATWHEGPEHGATTENARRVIDENARELDVPLAFLEPGVLYVARNFANGPDADPEARPESVEIREERVTVADTITLSLAPGGGQAIWFAPAR